MVEEESRRGQSERFEAWKVFSMLVLAWRWRQASWWEMLVPSRSWEQRLANSHQGNWDSCPKASRDWKFCRSHEWPGIQFYTRIFKKDFIYLFTFRERERKGEREGKKHECVAVSLAPPTGNPSHTRQPRHVPWLGIQLATFWFTGRHSIHWATPARASPESLDMSSA